MSCLLCPEQMAVPLGWKALSTSGKVLQHLLMIWKMDKLFKFAPIRTYSLDCEFPIWPMCHLISSTLISSIRCFRPLRMYPSSIVKDRSPKLTVARIPFANRDCWTFRSGVSQR